MTSLAKTRPMEAALGAVRPVTPPVRLLNAPDSPDAEAWARYFEDLYQGALGDITKVPWADAAPNPALLAWLNAEAPSLVRPGARVVVVGCGLGDDVAELVQRGYDVTGFDVSATAIDWAMKRHPELEGRLVVADLFDLPAHLCRRADLVVEAYTLQSMHPALRSQAAAAIASLARPHGAVLTICRGRDEDEPMGDEPPFALCPSELTSLMEGQGFSPVRHIDDYEDDEDPPQRRLRAAFKRR